MNTTETEKTKLPDDSATASSEQPASVPEPTDPETSDAPKKRAKAPSIENVVQLLQAVYAGRFKRVDLKKGELAALRAAPAPTEAERDDLYREAQLDRLLDKTRQLMLLGIRVEGPALPGLIREFARGVLERHPLFQSESLRAVLANLPEAMVEENAIKTVLSVDCASLTWAEDKKQLTKKQCDQCRRNAALCLLMLFWGSRGTSVERIQRHLQSTLWAPTSRGQKSDREKLYALISTRDPAAASVTFSLLDEVAIEQRRRAETAVRAEERALSRLARLEEQLAHVERDLTEATAEAERVRKEFEETSQVHATARAHWKDDYEQLRGQMLRRLKEELSLLDEGLHALRREPPKVHVMIDHAERAIDGLKREMERLRGNG